MKEQVDLEVQETNIDLTNYKTLVYNGVTYPDYMINFEGTNIYDLKNSRFATIKKIGSSNGFDVINNDKRYSFMLEKARVNTFYDEILKDIDITDAKVLVYGGIKYERYLIFPESKPRILDLNTLKILSTSKMKKTSKNSTQYWQVGISIDGKSKSVPAHVVIMWTFKGPPPEGMENPTVDHIDGNGLNNDLSNLQWLSCSDNIRRSRSGELCYKAKVNNDTVRAFCEDLLKSDITFTVKELGAKHGLSLHQSIHIYYRNQWKEIVDAYPSFPQRPVFKRKQKVTINTLF